MEITRQIYHQQAKVSLLSQNLFLFHLLPWAETSSRQLLPSLPVLQRWGVERGYFSIDKQRSLFAQSRRPVIRPSLNPGSSSTSSIVTLCSSTMGIFSSSFIFWSGLSNGSTEAGSDLSGRFSKWLQHNILSSSKDFCPNNYNCSKIHFDQSWFWPIYNSLKIFTNKLNNIVFIYKL